MFAPKIAQLQTKASIDSTNSIARQRSTQMAYRRGPDIRQQQSLQAPASSDRGQLWDFSHISIYPPESGKIIEAQAPTADSLIPDVSRPDSTFTHREIKIALPPRERAQLTVGPTPEAIAMLGAGRLLAPAERQLIADDVLLSDVQIHDDWQAQIVAALLGDAGFAAGEHIVLGDAEPSPRRDRLLAHELVHVLQQRSAEGRARSPDPEREAEWLAEHSRHGRSIAPGAAPQGFAEASIAKYTQDLGNDLLLIIDVDDGDFVGGCVAAYVPHLGVKVVKKGVPKIEGNQLFNIHLGITTNMAGETCFFFYESVSGLCEMKCFPTLDELKKSLGDIRDWIEQKVEQVLSFLLPAAVVAVVAYIIADAIVTALAAAGILVLA